MSRGSPEKTQARREEILDVAQALYQEKPYHAITIGDIGARTSFGRTSVYTYFQTKDEIFMAFMAREYDAWSATLEKETARHTATGAKAFAAMLAQSLVTHPLLFKLLSMNLYEMESRTRLEHLTAFKRSYGQSRKALEAAFCAYIPQADDEMAETFLCLFYPFLFGVYPYTNVTPEQAQAMDAAGVPPHTCGLVELVEAFTLSLVKGLLAGHQI